MPAPTGKFVWYELMTSDAPAAEAFYRHVAGWTAQDAGLSDRSYTILSAGAVPIGGLMPIPPEVHAAGGKPGWIGYLAVGDVDAHAGRVEQAGGSIHRVPEDIPGVGRFAVVSDPQGAAFVLFKGLSDQPPQPDAPGTPGQVGWNELTTSDWRSAWGFYESLFGWTQAEAIDMGPMGIYQTFAIDAAPCGGMMNRTDPAQPAAWLYYVNVDDIDAARARVIATSGRVLNGPHEVPGGSWVMQCQDPQGAVFALAGPKKR
jgi:uncharacterized protein